MKLHPFDMKPRARPVCTPEIMAAIREWVAGDPDQRGTRIGRATALGISEQLFGYHANRIAGRAKGRT